MDGGLLRKKGWPNCGMCYLYKKIMESVTHIRQLSLHCEDLGASKGMVGSSWASSQQWLNLSIKAWWSLMAEDSSSNHKVFLLLYLPLQRFGTGAMP
jgi:hypothetical protein